MASLLSIYLPFQRLHLPIIVLFWKVRFADYTIPDLTLQLVQIPIRKSGAFAFFTHMYWDLETTMTTFKNNIILRTHLEHSGL